MVAAGVDSASDRLSGPRGARPRRALSRRNIFIYGTLILVAVYYLIPLYVMIVTSLKGMPEIRLGNIFAPPVEITFEPTPDGQGTVLVLHHECIGAVSPDTGATYERSWQDLIGRAFADRLRAG